MKLNMLDINIKKHCIDKDTSVKDACLYIIENGLDICPVVDNEQITGIITKEKLIKLMLLEENDILIGNGIDKEYIKINHDDEVSQILKHIGKPMLIFKNNQYIGILNRNDIRNIAKSELDVLNQILDAGYEWYVTVNKDGIITKMSDNYKKYWGDNDPEGKHVTEVIKNTRMHEVVKSGKAEVSQVQEIIGQHMMAMRFPIKKDNEVVGAVGKAFVKDVKELITLSKKLKSMEEEIEYYKEQLKRERGAKYSLENIIGFSEKLEIIKKLAKKASKTESNVLITGESGTGKELIAHAIHNESKRSSNAFIKINCAAIPSDLLESELFGYDPGAFTGAKKEGKKGKFEMADGGTIFLDEVGDMPIDMQVKLLRVIQEREVDRLGSTETKKVDVRIICATNKDLNEEVKKGSFRQDLYYRLNVMNIHMYPLRERKEDITPLIRFFVEKLSNKMGIYINGISDDTIKCLQGHDWPGNIRELENVVERAINLVDTDLIIKKTHLPNTIVKNTYKQNYKLDQGLKEILEYIEKEIILNTLKENNGNKQKTSKILNMSRTKLYQKLNEYGYTCV